MRTWLLFDCHSLAYRAFHAVGGLHYNNQPTSVIFNFLGTIIQLQGQFETDNCVFCFDFGKPKREKLYPNYKRKRKQSRKEHTPQEQRLYRELKQQIELLRTTYLPGIGFRNVYFQKGYEADDLIASAVKSLNGDAAIIISSDKDLYQLLSKRVSVWDPRARALWTKNSFKNVYRISPKDWAWVKALSGCGSDEVEGLRGIGEKTAIKYLLNELKCNSTKHKQILQYGPEIVRRNLPLVKLPMEGTKPIPLRRDKTLDWKPVLSQLGIKSLNPDPIYKERER